MPQMMPMSWLSLSIMFSMTLILFALMNYYTKVTTTNALMKQVIMTKSLNWKW
uniref:ATP synthase F0 subunit 8 n=1 Tax=Neotermes cf. insularis/malandensis TaxID=2942759 RepID=A0A8X8M1H5_9NEOP|nr:ATP synthase F0 subunit 8 [Neotermes cf. insularis/malandensis]URX52777.1 ATP synthase F0 subunit 8 [Neotermes cf. insularis/malandensis]